MKKTIVALLSTVLLCMLYLFSSCYFPWEIKQMKEYYSDDSNYITRTGKFVRSSYIEQEKFGITSETGTLKFEYEENNHIYSVYLYVTKQNRKVLEQNNFFEEVEVGCEVTYRYVPIMFGDGYIPPLAEIIYNGKIYLDFETGKENILIYVDNINN